MSTVEKTVVADTGASAEKGSASSPVGKFVRTRVAVSNVTGSTLVTGDSDSSEYIFFPDSPVDSSAPLEQLFPHWHEGEVDAAAAVYRLKQAQIDLHKVAVLGAGEEMEAANLKALAESSLFGALPRANFNPAFYSVLSFCAWALRNASPVGIEEPMKLARLVGAILELRDNPYLDYGRGSEIIDELREAGWNGDAPAVSAFRAALNLDDEDEFKLER